MKTIILRILSVVLVCLTMIAIFSFSSQPASDSSKLSTGFTYKLFSVFYPDFNNMTESEKADTIENFPLPIRKVAHFSLYFFLGVFAFFSIITYNILSALPKGLISFGFCVIYAISDEIHQYFVPGRSCELRDVLIDSAGAFLSTIILLTIYKIISKKKV